MTAAFAPPGSRPDAKVFRVEDLIRYARAGRIRVPPFQRGFKWERVDVENLVDSIWRGFPVGTLLLWSKPAPAGTAKLGDLSFDVNQQKEAWFVVDGQQRIVSLVSTLVPDTDRRPMFDLYFDLAEGKVTHVGRSEAPATFLPLDRVVDSEDLLAWLDEHRNSLSTEQTRLALRVGKLLREYEIPAYIVDIEDESVVREIFSRTNDTGKRLEASDVFNALHAPLGETPAASLKDVVDRLKGRSLGDIEEVHVLRSILAIEGKDRSGDLSRQLKDVDVPAAVARTEQALERVFAFLAQDAGIPHLRLLPYTSPLAVLSAFFDRFPTPSGRARRLLSRWLWRGIASEELRGDGKGTRPALAALREYPSDEEAAVGVLNTVSPERPSPQPLAAFNLRHARPRVLAIVLVRLRPRDLWSGETMNVQDLLTSTDDVFRQIYGAPDSTPEEQRSLFFSVGNRLLHGLHRDPTPDTTSSFVKKLQARSKLSLPTSSHGVTDTHVLASHGIHGAALGFLEKGDRVSFLEARRDWLEGEATKLIDSRSEWGHADRVSIAAMAGEDD